MTSLIDGIDFEVIDLDKRETNFEGKIRLDYNELDIKDKPVWLQIPQKDIELQINLNKGTKVNFFWSQSGELQQKVQATFNLLGENINLGIYNFQHLKGQSKVQNHLQINHLAANCKSFTLFKSALDEEVQADFFGKIYVTPEAHETDAKLGNHNLMLSDSAKVNTRPELEIYCDDVKCTHGATIGRFDKTQEFYLQSRGLELAVRKQILTEAFLREVVESLKI